MSNPAAEEFFNSLPQETEEEQKFDIFKEPDAKPEGTPEAEKPEDAKPALEAESEEEQPERKKPLRSERRAEKQTEFMQKQWQDEREARIRLEEQVKALAENRKIEVDPDIKKLLTEVNNPEEATRIFEGLIQKAQQRAEESALSRLQENQAKGDQEVDALADTIEENIESIEDRYGVDLTDDSKTRNAFLDFVDSIAPPNSDELPNMDAAWKYFQATRKPSTSNVERKQQIASRGMVRSSSPKPEGKDLKPMSFESLNQGNWWEKLIGGK